MLNDVAGITPWDAPLPPTLPKRRVDRGEKSPFAVDAIEETKMKGQDASLEDVLDEVRKAASKGYRHSVKENWALRRLLVGSRQRLLKQMAESRSGKIAVPEITENLRTQVEQIEDALKELVEYRDETLERERQRLHRFTITLFGRTMAGKSTLMEILTKGDGRSIGKGAQRTTRDIRTYQWKNLDIVDVPGVAAFEGREDEETAFEAAEAADLILFLITDDAPQAREAECLVKLRRLGRPVIGICNVKIAIRSPRDLELFLGRVEKRFQRERIRALVRQFLELGEKHGLSSPIEVVPTHLQARFLAERPEFRPHREELLHASRFDDVERRIVAEVRNRGEFLRMKHFIDGSVRFSLQWGEAFLAFSEENSSRGRDLIERRRSLQDLLNDLEKEERKRIAHFVATISRGIRKQIPDIVEEYYDRDDAGRAWKRAVERERIQERTNALLEKLQVEWEKRLEEFAAESKEMFHLLEEFRADDTIEMDRISDPKGIWQRLTTIAGGILALASIFGGGAGLGFVAAGISILGSWLGSFLFEDRGRKVARQRRRLQEKLERDAGKIETKLEKKLDGIAEQRAKWGRGYLQRFDAVISLLFELADMQREMGFQIIGRARASNHKLVEEALHRVGYPWIAEKICGVARIPGEVTLLVVPHDLRESFTALDLPEWPGRPKGGKSSLGKMLEHLLGERVAIVSNGGTDKDLIERIVCSPVKVNKGWAYLSPKGKPGKERREIRLAQQLTKLHIMRRQGSQPRGARDLARHSLF